MEISPEITYQQRTMRHGTRSPNLRCEEQITNFTGLTNTIISRKIQINDFK